MPDARTSARARGTLAVVLGRLAGGPGCRVAARADIATWAGPAYAVRRSREERRFDPARVPRVYDRLWRDAAQALGATVTDLGSSVLEIRRGDQRTRVTLIVTDIDGLFTVQLALDKRLVHELLTAAGVPVPENVEVRLSEPAAADAFLARAGGPVVVKPASGTSGGTGITSGIRSPSDLRRACVRAARSDGRLLLERQVAGDEYRLLMLDGRLIGAVRRRPPRLVGDGRATVAELIAERNRRRIAAGGHAGTQLLTVDLDAVLQLERLGLGLRSVPAQGQAVPFKTMASEAGPDETDTVPPGEVSGALLDECRAAADAIGLRLAGIDLITPDLGRSLHDAGGAVIEVNGTPGLHYHYQVGDPGRADRVAEPVLDALLRASVPATPAPAGASR